MDTCEGPWGKIAADKSIEDASWSDFRDPRRTFRILERGAGLNISGTRLIRRLNEKDGPSEYHVIELNEEVADRAEEWREEQLRQLAMITKHQGIKSGIKIFIHRGEAKEETARLVREEKKKFDIILSDTFPITKAEEGINDIIDIDVIKEGLTRNGVFTFFAYHPGAENIEENNDLLIRQLNRVSPHFKTTGINNADVKPAKGYDYLFRPDGTPIRRLPAFTCIGKR